MCINIEGKENFEYFKQLSDKSRAEILSWFEKVLMCNPKTIIIYRPHPDEAKKSIILKELEAKYSNFRVISELALKHWINACDKIYNWYSTGQVDVNILAKPYRFLRPECIKQDIDYKLFLGIEIGWEYLEGPFLTTNSQKNVLKTLNFKNAFEVYKEVVEKDSGMKFEDDNFFDIAKSYPLGIIKYDKEIVVRDPILIDKNNNMVLVGDIPHHSTINILKGKAENLIKSSGNAIKKAMEQLDCEQNENSVILFDCISRSIFLGDNFVKELEEIEKQMKPSKNLFGALTLGEIVNNGNEYITFYNKTCVIGVLC